MKRVTFLVGLSLLMFACNQDNNKDYAHAEHDTHSEVKHEAYLMSGLDHGLMQSPINILSNEAGTGKHNITFNFTVFDNLDTILTCDLNIDGSSNLLFNITNNTNELHYLVFQ